MVWLIQINRAVNLRDSTEPTAAQRSLRTFSLKTQGRGHIYFQSRLIFSNIVCLQNGKNHTLPNWEMSMINTALFYMLALGKDYMLLPVLLLCVSECTLKHFCRLRFCETREKATKVLDLCGQRGSLLFGVLFCFVFCNGNAKYQTLQLLLK